MRKSRPSKKGIAYKIPYVKRDPASNTQGPFTTWALTPESVPNQISPWEMRGNKNWADKYEWRENDVFEANLKFLKLSWDGKAILENTDNEARYYMGKTGLDELLQKGTIVCGTVLGHWKFKKHGNSYAIFPVFS